MSENKEWEYCRSCQNEKICDKNPSMFEDGFCNIFSPYVHISFEQAFSMWKEIESEEKQKEFIKSLF